MRGKPITEEVANKIYGVLIEHAGCHDGAKNGEDDHTRNSFVVTATEGKWTEWRFGGALRFGGKVWNNDGRWYVSCYREDEQALQTSVIKRTNAALDKLFEETYGEPPRRR